MFSFVVTDPRVGANLERDTPSKRVYFIDNCGTWIHQEDMEYILSLERPGCACKGGGMVKPAYHLAKASADRFADKPVK